MDYQFKMESKRLIAALDEKEDQKKVLLKSMVEARVSSDADEHSVLVSLYGTETTIYPRSTVL